METTLPNGNDFTTHQEARAAGHELLRRNVVEAASSLLTEEGPEALTVRRVAQMLHCSTKIIYTMFQGKEGLANALYVEGCMHLSQAITELPEAAAPEVYLPQLAWAYWTFALDHPSHYAVLFGGAIPRFQPSEASKQMISLAMEAVVKVLHSYITQRLLPVQDPVKLTRALWAPLHGVVALYLLGHFSDEEEAKQAFARTVHALVSSLSTAASPESSRSAGIIQNET